MKLLFKQRMFSWLDSYDIYYEDGSTAYVVKGQLSWGHCLKIFDPTGYELGAVKERVLTWMPTFDLYLGDRQVGSMHREWSFWKPRYHFDFNGWQVQGDILEWNYTILGPQGDVVAVIAKEVWNWTDTYVIDLAFPDDALCVLMFVLAVDAEKCSRN